MIVDDGPSAGRRARHQPLRIGPGGLPEFSEVDDIANFEQIQRGLMAIEDEWVYMHRGLGMRDRIKT